MSNPLTKTQEQNIIFECIGNAQTNAELEKVELVLKEYSKSNPSETSFVIDAMEYIKEMIIIKSHEKNK